MAVAGNLRIGRLLLAAFSCFFVFSMSLQAALANSANIAAGDVHFERRSANTSSKLSWQWHASGTVVFSVARTQDPGALLYSREGTEDSGSVTVPFDDTYILLWFNPGNLTLTLSYSSTVEAGTGSAFLYAAVVLILAVMILIAVLSFRRRKRSEEDSREPPEGQSESPNTEMPSAVPPPPGPPQIPAPPPPPGPIPATGNIFCRRCGRPSSQEAVFCVDCGYPLG